MKSIVTGGAGFIGSYVIDLLIKHGHEVVVIDNLATTGDLRNIKGKDVNFLKEDITNREKIFEIFENEKPDYVFHLAAQASVSVSVKNPELDYKVNVEGSQNIIDASGKTGVKKIIYSGSGGSIYGDCYLEKFDDPLKVSEEELIAAAPDENFAFKPISPYAKNKAKVIELLQNQDKVKWTALMYSNVYGPRQDPHGEAGVIAIFCQKMANGEQPTIFGGGVCIRDYVYCLDVARANIIAIDKGDNEWINIGTSIGRDVNWLFDVIKKEIGFDKEAFQAPFREGDVVVNILNNKKAKEVLDWKPHMKLDEGLKKTIEFFK